MTLDVTSRSFWHSTDFVIELFSLVLSITMITIIGFWIGTLNYFDFGIPVKHYMGSLQRLEDGFKFLNDERTLCQNVIISKILLSTRVS